MEFKEKGFVFVLAEPEISTRQLNENDEFILLACDGLYDVMSNDDAVNMIHDCLYKQNMNAQQTTQHIVNHCINQLNTRDNVTAIVVKLRDTPAPKQQNTTNTTKQYYNVQSKSTNNDSNRTQQSTQSTPPRNTITTTTNANRASYRGVYGNNRDLTDSPTELSIPASRLSISDASLFEPPE